MEYNEALANHLLFKYENEIRLSAVLMEAQVICLGMMMEIKQFEAKKGSNTKTKANIERIDKLLNALDKLLKMDDYNYRLRVVLASSQRKINELESKVESLEKQQKATLNAWNST